MSVELSLTNIEQQLYAGHARGSCSYLPNQNSSLLFLDGNSIGDVYRLLLDRGYRRHGMQLYRPDCENCMECHVIRIPLKEFKATKSQKRVLKRANRVFEIKIVEPKFTIEKLNLYKEYLRFQHNRRSDTNSESGYTDFFVDSFLDNNTFELQVYFEDELCGVGVFDVVADAVSAVYFYFNQKISHLSPGTFNVLELIRWGIENNLEYLYPGFYIPDCKAMNYKTRFLPYQLKKASQKKWQKNAENYQVEDAKVDK